MTPSRPRGGAYRAGSLATLAGTALSLGGGVASLWLLARVLGREGFGSYAFATSAVLLLALVASLGLDRVLLLRVAGLSLGDGVLRGRGLAWRAGLLAGAAALALAAAAALLAPLLPGEGDSYWLAALAPATVPLALALVARAWLQANHRTGLANLMPGVTDAGRALLIGLVWALGGGAWGVAAAVTTAAAAPVVAVGLAATGPWRARTRRSPRRLGRRDLGGGALFLVQALSVQGMTLVDLLVVGLVASGAVTADYALAARLAALGDLGRVALKPTFTARARRHLTQGDRARLVREFHALRLGGALFALAVATALAALGPALLGLFGPFEGAYPALLLLAASAVAVGGAGMHSSVLAMTGELVPSSAIRAAALGLLVALLAWAAPRFGATGAAAAMLATQVAAAGAMGALMRRRTGLASLPAPALLVLVAAIALLVLAAGGLLPEPVVVPALLALGLLAAWVERRALLDLLALLAGRQDA